MMNVNLLLIEPDDSLRQLLGLALSKHYRVLSARNALQAWAWLRRGQIPHVIIAEACMPDINGQQFLSKLRCSGLFQHIPVLMLGSDAPDEEHLFQRFQAVRYLRKPFDMEDLRRQLKLLQPDNRPSRPFNFLRL
jgi:two-component system, chemotaxis family, chemotaxis protein CheY